MLRLLFVFILVSVLSCLGASASPMAVLVKNIHQQAGKTELNPNVQAVMDKKVFMTGNDGVHGEELWVSDGTATGTRMLKDLFPGPHGSTIAHLTASGARVFFSANDGVHGQELWVTDGTETGTRMVADLIGEPGLGIVPERMLALKKGVAFVSRQMLDSAFTLWFSDGTETGTLRLRSAPATPARDPYGQPPATASDSHYYTLLPNPASSFYQLCVTDGTAAGTSTLMDLPINEFGPSEGIFVNLLGAVGKTVYFHRVNYGTELWKSNGTPQTTMRVKALNVTGGIVNVGGKGWFVAALTNDLGESTYHVWTTNGTETGTKPVAVIDPMLALNGLTAIGQKLYAGYENGEDSTKGLWCYDTARKTQTLVSIPAESYLETVSQIAGTDRRVFFVTTHIQEEGRHRFWVTDGTPEGTKPASQAFGPEGGATWGSQEKQGLAALGQSVYFMASTETEGAQLWKSDGTGTGTAPVPRLQSQDGHADPQQLRTLGGFTYFSADDGLHGRELWRTDGTAGSTQMIADIRPGSAGSSPAEMTEMAGIVYFSADGGETGREFWRTDGTSAGTWQVKDIFQGVSGSDPAAFHVFSGHLYFQARTAAAGSELWVSDGTDQGTAMMANLYADAGAVYDSSPAEFMEMDGKLYFTAVYNRSFIYNHRRTYRTNGFPAAVEPVLGHVQPLLIRPPVQGAAVEPAKAVMYGVAELHAYSDLALWRYSGTGTLVTAIKTLPDTRGTDYTAMDASGDLVFLECEGTFTQQLWRSDGTAAGTFRLTEGAADLVKAVGGKVYYQNRSWWLNDGTGLRCMNLDGTGSLELLPQSTTARIRPLHVEGDTLFFARSVTDQRAGAAWADGWTLWQTQGTPETTREVSPRLLAIPPDDANLRPGPYSVARLGNRLYFSAEDPEKGAELHSLDLAGQVQVAQVLPEGGTRPLADADTVDLGVMAVSTPRNLSLQISNTGWQPLTGLTLTRLPEISGGPAPQPLETLAPGASVTLEIPCTMTASGLDATALRLSGSDPDSPFTFLMNLTGKSVQNDGPPVINRISGSRLALASETVIFNADVLPITPFTTYLWRQSGKEAGSLAELTLPAVSTAHAALYTLQVTGKTGGKPTTVTSSPSVLAVVLPAQASALVVEWSALTLTCSAKTPPGSTLSYQWLHNGHPLASAAGVQGSHTPTLKIPRMEQWQAGKYDCRVTLTAPDRQVSLNHGVTTVTVSSRPRLLSPDPLWGWGAMVGMTTSYQLQTDIPATVFTAKGLPPGLTMSPSGLITGKVTRPRGPAKDAFSYYEPYQVTLSAGNAAGMGPPITVPWQAEFVFTPGSYDGLIDRNETLDGGFGLGSRVQFTVTPTGGLSGQLRHGRKTYRFTGAGMEIGFDVYELPATITIPRGTGELPLKLTFQYPQEIILKESDEVLATGVLRQQYISTVYPLDAYVGAYTWQLSPPEGSGPEVPSGAGFMTASISKTGVATWKGKLADGTAVTGSAALASQDLFGGNTMVLHLHHELYGITGSLHGAVKLPSYYGAYPPLAINGTLTWNKPAQPPQSKERLYKAGFPLHELMLLGGSYRPPAKDELLLGLPEAPDNASITLQGASLAEAMNPVFTFTAKHKAELPPVDATQPVKILTFNLKTGTFQGTLLFTHENPKLNRPVPCEGVILPPDQSGSGFFLLPDLPGEEEPVSALKTTPIQSGLIRIAPVP